VTSDVDRDEAVFAELYPSLLRLAAVVRPPEVDAHDLVQEALVQTLLRGPLSSLDDPEAYLRVVLVRLVSNHRRRLGRRRRALVRGLGGTENTATPSYPSELHDLMRVSPIDRAVLYLSLVEQRSFREIGELVGCSEQAARARSSRALRRLRVELEEEASDG
jgi:DNA-directed RNA polymerase specialized sigma24 family protein